MVELGQVNIYCKVSMMSSCLALPREGHLQQFVATKHAIKYSRGLRYKLRTIDFPVEGCAYIYGDNQSVLVNTTTPHSQLKKKSNNVA